MDKVGGRTCVEHGTRHRRKPCRPLVGQWLFLRSRKWSYEPPTGSERSQGDVHPSSASEDFHLLSRGKAPSCPTTSCTPEQTFWGLEKRTDSPRLRSAPTSPFYGGGERDGGESGDAETWTLGSPVTVSTGATGPPPVFTTGQRQNIPLLAQSVHSRNLGPSTCASPPSPPATQPEEVLLHSPDRPEGRVDHLQVGLSPIYSTGGLVRRHGPETPVDPGRTRNTLRLDVGTETPLRTLERTVAQGSVATGTTPPVSNSGYLGRSQRGTPVTPVTPVYQETPPRQDP